MTIYLVTLVIALLGGLFHVNKSYRSRRRYVFFIFSIIILISALRHYTIGIDLKNQYYNLFIRVADMNWSDIGNTAYDVGYVVFNKIISMFTTNPQWFIAIHSIIVFGITGWFILRYSDDVVMSTFLFIANNVWFMYMNVLRQALAICVILIAFAVWEKKEWKLKRYLIYGMLYLLAVSFHSSAALMIVIPIIAHVKFRRNQIVVSGIIVGFAFLLYDKIFEIASRLIGFRRNYSLFYEGTTAGKSAINLNSLYGILIYVIFFLIAYYSLIYHRQVSEKRIGNDSIISVNNEGAISLLMYLTLFLIICRALVWRSSIIGRMAYYFIPFTWILVPKAIKEYPGINNKYILRIMIYCGITLMFIWMGYRSANTLYGTVPYRFFLNR